MGALNERILIVDDEEDLWTLMCEALQNCGLDVETVASAEACLERLDQVGFDVVITDVEMPGMSGIDLCQLLSRRCPPLPTIVVTGLRDLTARSAAFANGAFEFLLKPIKLVALEAAIRRACAHLPATGPALRLD